ncbi:MAG TPA: c-type cytochrome, partial [Opitutaceae bacterium]
RDLDVLFGEGRALAEVRALALDPRADLAARQAALGALIEARPADLRAVCERLLRVRFLNPAAARGLALFDGEDVAELIATAYGTFFHPSERSVAIDVLVTRPAFAGVLLSYVEKGQIPRAALTPFHARQIRSLGSAPLVQRLDRMGGGWGEPPSEMQAVIARLKAELTPAGLAAADVAAGRRLFAQLCGACHALNGEGGSLGPDLTGSQRDNLDYLLENIVAPGAVVSADYRMTIVRMKDGRTLNGFIPTRTERTLTVRSMAETITVDRAEIERIEESAASLMPEGLIESLTSDQRRDLIAYLSEKHK